MTEQHECEWIVSEFEPLAYCEGCMVEEQVVTFLERDEIERRLNATEMLSAKLARKAWGNHPYPSAGGPEQSALLAYANALERNALEQGTREAYPSETVLDDDTLEGK